MSGVVVSDSTALIVLEKADLMLLLKQSYDEILIPAAVRAEVGEAITRHPFIHDRTATDRLTIQRLMKRFDPGESEAIALAREHRLPLLIDERKGRAVARSEGVEIIGVLGMIVRLHRKGEISQSDALAYRDRLQSCGLYLLAPLDRQLELLLTLDA